MAAKFWRLYPALLYALAGLVGCFSAFYSLWCFLLLIPFFFDGHKQLSKPYLVRLFFGLIVLLCFHQYASTTYHLPSLPVEGIRGSAHIQIQFLSQTTTHYGKQWVYKGRIRSFAPDNQADSEYRGSFIPFRLALKQQPDLQRPLANCEYIVKGLLKPSPSGQYFLYADKEEPWRIIDKSWSLAEWQYQTKEKISHYIKRHITNPLATTFLSGIATGNFDDRRMQFEFGRFGLQHIMAISGFHFAIIASILGCLLRLVVPLKTAILSLILLVSSYFVILGPSPSVMRAWLTILVALCGYLLNKRGSALNSLGVAMLVVLVYDPYLCSHIGFQLSFLATAAILMLFNGIDHGLKYIFFKRPLSEVIQMNRLNQHGYLLLSYCRQGIALSLAVNLATLPLLLFYFHKFSLMSLVYNLFFPFLVSLSMVMLILGMVGSIVYAPLGQLVHQLNDYYTSFMLNYIYNMPRTVDRYWTVESIPLYAVILGLWGAFYLGIWLHHLAEKQRESQLDLAYL